VSEISIMDRALGFFRAIGVWLVVAAWLLFVAAVVWHLAFRSAQQSAQRTFLTILGLQSIG
jgi:hypothetical protein